MSKYIDKIISQYDKVIGADKVITKEDGRKQCKSFNKCKCGFCTNYTGSRINSRGNRKSYFQSCAGRCKVKAY